MKHLCILLLLLAVVAVSGKKIKFRPCPGVKTLGVVENAYIVPCEKLPCIFHRGSSANLTFDFSSTVATKTLTNVVHGNIASVWVPFPLSHTDGCTTSGVTCPLVPGQMNHFNYSIPIKAIYPPLALDVKFEFQGDNQEEIACIEFSAQIK